MRHVKEKGFTMVELMVVIAILVLLIVAFLPKKVMKIEVAPTLIGALPTSGSAEAMGYSFTASVDGTDHIFAVLTGSKPLLTMACDETAGACIFTK